MALTQTAFPTPPPAPADGPAEGLWRIDFSALGTKCLILAAPVEESRWVAFQQEAMAWLGAFEARYSRFQPDSLISRINAAAGREWVAVDPDTERMFVLCDTLHYLTRGILDPTVLPLLKVWNYRDTQASLPTEEAVEAARAKVGWMRFRREPGRVLLPEVGMGLDLGGFGKEYAVDQVAACARAHGLTALIDFGHDLYGLGQPPGRPAWHAGLEDPNRPGSAWGGAALLDRGMAASGDYLRCRIRNGRRYGHIIDPRTGYPVDNGVQAVYVIATSCLEAGLLATQCFILGFDEALVLLDQSFGAAGCLVGGRQRAFSRDFHRYLVPATS